jgi:hypothetical protein
MELDETRALHWLGVGAQPSDAVRRIMVKLGTMDRLQRLKAGEALEDLLAEAEAEAAQRPIVDPRTRRDDLLEDRQKAKAEARAKAQAEAEVEVEAEAEAETEVEAEVEAEAEAEAEVEAEETEEVEETETPSEPEAEAE